MSDGSRAAVRSVGTIAPDAWNERTVDVPGGHVMQGTCWADQRRSGGGTPLFVTFEDGRCALVTTRPQRPFGIFAAARKGPVHAGDAPERVAARAAALADVVRARGASELFIDPEMERSEAYRAAVAKAGFLVTDEAQPSIHLLRLDLPSGTPEDQLWASIAKSTRQRIQAARRAGVTVRADTAGECLDAFATLLAVRSEDLGVHLRPEFGSLPFSRRLMAAGQARLYVAERDSELLGGLLVYLQGGAVSTIYSADRADRRHAYPGVMHLVRWTLICDAVAAGMPFVDLGGVDLPGHRQPPRPGDPTYGLYEHKASFGAIWVEREPARRMVLRPWADRAARAGRWAVGRARRTGGSAA